MHAYDPFRVQLFHVQLCHPEDDQDDHQFPSLCLLYVSLPHDSRFRRIFRLCHCTLCIPRDTFDRAHRIWMPCSRHSSLSPPVGPTNSHRNRLCREDCWVRNGHDGTVRQECDDGTVLTGG